MEARSPEATDRDVKNHPGEDPRCTHGARHSSRPGDGVHVSGAAAQPVRITSYLGGGIVTAFVGLFVTMAAWAAAGEVSALGAPAWLAYGGPLALGGALLLGLYTFLSTEYVVDVDSSGIRFATHRRVGPFRGAADVIVAARWDETKMIREEVRVSRTRHGDVQRRYALRIDGATIDGGLMGTMQRDGKYLALIKAVEAALGRAIDQDEIAD